VEATLRHGDASSELCEEILVALDEALGRLGQWNDRQMRIVECRFFGSMSIEDTAAALGVSPATVKRGWSLAQAWLFRDLTQRAEGGA
jgi:DNA-directed RNA polymerase specialized sigma subunit